MITFGSLFAGIGGFDLGFERAGMTCKWQVEIDDYATKVLEKHWPHVRRHRDIKTFPTGPSDEWKVDVICGGFPCQDISYAGKGAGLNGERSGLFFELARVVRVLGPRIVVLENVAALLARGLDSVLGTLASLGYDAEWHCIPAACVGAPHIRDRVFILAFPESERRGETRRLRQLPSQRASSSGEVLADASNEYQSQGEGVCSWNWNEAKRPNNRDGGQESRGDWWAVEPELGRVAHGIPFRVDRLRCLGNAVVPQVAEFVGRRVVEVLQKASEKDGEA